VTFRDRALLGLRLLAGEGPGSLVRRLLDRASEGRRRDSFPEVGLERLGVRAPVLNLLSTPPAVRLGGVQTGMLRRLEQEVARRPVALLYPFGRGYRLEAEDRGRRAAAILDAAPPGTTPRLRDEAFEAAVARAAAAVGSSVVHVENLSSFAPGSVGALVRHGLRLVLTIQDFAPFCPRPHLLEQPADAFCGYSTDPDRCRRCLGESWDLDPGFLPEYRRLAAEALRSAAALVYLSPFVRDRLAVLVPGLDAGRQHVIAPSSGTVEPRPPRSRSTTLHVAYVGAVKPHKGALVFEGLVGAARDSSPAAMRWSAYGGGDAAILKRLRGLGVAVHGYYRAGSLPGLLRRDAVDVALVLSIWPETYALVVDECLMAGVPVVAFDLGAPAERLRGGQGVLLPPGAGPQELLRAVAEAALREAPRPTPVTPAGSADAMLALYARIGALPPA
jgi:glycosyltransferase involved in cell wall biosynthesis